MPLDMSLEIESIDCYRGQLPFRQSFSHSSATRSKGESIFVGITDASGLTGIGEGCPREYVTGESTRSALRFVANVNDQARKIRDLDSLRSFVSANRTLIDKDPAAWCAVEVALLDLLAKCKQVSVESLLRQTEMRDEYRYTAIMGLADPQTFKTLFRCYRQLGLSDFKVKLSGQLSLDRVLLEQMRPDREYIRVRADANNLWNSADEAARYLKELEWPICAMEEPLQVADIDELEVLHDKTGIQIILDESLLRLKQLAPLGRNAGIWNANVRVSKMGGLLRSLEMIGKLRELDVDITIGAHVGETSLLTRAALILADAAGRHLTAQEGAFGEHLLQSDPMTTLIQFGKEGKLNTGSMNYRNYHGFGLSCEPGFTSQIFS